MKHLLWLILIWTFQQIANAAEVVQMPPLCLADDASAKSWVEQIVRDAPPVGGEITCLRVFPLKYGERDGGIWVVPAVVHVTIKGYPEENEMIFLVYHCQTQKGELYLAFGIPEKELPKYLHADHAILMPTHPWLAFDRDREDWRYRDYRDRDDWRRREWERRHHRHHHGVIIIPDSLSFNMPTHPTLV